MPRELAALDLAVGLMVAALSGCSSAASTEPASCEAQYGPSKSVVVTGDDHQGDRLACKFGPGETTKDTVGDSIPKPPISHVIVLMMENRSFDHYFSNLPSTGVTDVDVATGPQLNPDGKGGWVPRYHETEHCFGSAATPSHEWSDAHVAHAAGRMDGFVVGSGTCGAMAYYTETDLPFYYSLAKTFAISDRHFAPLLGPTWPNRLFFLAGTSCGYAEGTDTNPDITLNCGVTRPNILTELSAAGHSYKVYDESGFFSSIVGLGVYLGAPSSIQDFVNDATSGTLPDVAILGASTGQGLAPSEDDEHPPANILLGQSFVYRAVTALMANATSWSSSVMFLTYDEYGGFYDHVEPPAACDPEASADAGLRDYDFGQYGFRVPLIAISPYARASHVSHFDSDHTSITRFIEHVFGLGALTKRDANAWPLLDLFDFTQPAAATPSFSAPPAGTVCATAPPPTCQK